MLTHCYSVKSPEKRRKIALVHSQFAGQKGPFVGALLDDFTGGFAGAMAGLGVNAYEQAQIYSEMLSYRQWPRALFAGSDQTISQLRTAMTWNQ